MPFTPTQPLWLRNATGMWPPAPPRNWDILRRESNGGRLEPKWLALSLSLSLSLSPLSLSLSLSHTLALSRKHHLSKQQANRHGPTCRHSNSRKLMCNASSRFLFTRSPLVPGREEVIHNADKVNHFKVQSRLEIDAFVAGGV